MDLFFFNIMEEVFLKHYELPFHSVKHLELYLINFMAWLCVNEEVCMIEKSIHQKIRAILDIIDFARRRLDEKILWHPSLTFL